MKKLVCGIIAIGLVALLTGVACASPSFLGISGNIYTPDDQIMEAGDFNASYHSIDLDSTSPNILSAGLGITENLELSVARVDPDTAADTDTIINAKYSILRETASRPSFVAGVIDTTSELNSDPSLFVVLGKNLTPAASGISGQPVAPLKGYIGAGSGQLDGFFAGATWSFSERAQLMGEYTNFNNDSAINAGVRFNLSNNLSGDVAILDSDDFAFGLNFTKIGF